MMRQERRPLIARVTYQRSSYSPSSSPLLFSNISAASRTVGAPSRKRPHSYSVVQQRHLIVSTTSSNTVITVSRIRSQSHVPPTNAIVIATHCRPPNGLPSTRSLQAPSGSLLHCKTLRRCQCCRVRHTRCLGRSSRIVSTTTRDGASQYEYGIASSVEGSHWIVGLVPCCRCDSQCEEWHACAVSALTLSISTVH